MHSPEENARGRDHCQHQPVPLLPLAEPESNVTSNGVVIRQCTPTNLSLTEEQARRREGLTDVGAPGQVLDPQ